MNSKKFTSKQQKTTNKQRDKLRRNTAAQDGAKATKIAAISFAIVIAFFGIYESTIRTFMVSRKDSEQMRRTVRQQNKELDDIRSATTWQTFS